MADGVSLVAPETVWFAWDTEIGRDSREGFALFDPFLEFRRPGAQRFPLLFRGPIRDDLLAHFVERPVAFRRDFLHLKPHIAVLGEWQR